MSLLEIRTLGRIQAIAPDGGTITLPTRRAAALCAYLAVESAREHGRDELVALLWPDAAGSRGRANLRKTLSRLRRALPETVRSVLHVRGDSVSFDQTQVDCDLPRYQRAIAEHDVVALECALDLYRGPFLSGFYIDSDAFEAWAGEWRRLGEESMLEGLHSLLRHYTSAGRIGLAMGVAVRLLGMDPLHESVHRSLMHLYLAQGRVGAAIAQYERCRGVLAQELNVEPDEETQALYAEIKAGVPIEALEPDPARPVTLPATIGVPLPKRNTHGRPSIAILPFSDLSPGGDVKHIALGLSEEIITALACFRELEVIAAHSAFVYGASGLTPERAGASLGVRYRLEGSLRATKGRLRATARLVNNEDGRHLWVDTFESREPDLLTLQDEITRRIVGTLMGRIEYERIREVRKKSPRDWEAQDLWLKGREMLRRTDFRSMARARHYFRRAVEKDSSYASAHAGLAMTEMRGWACFNWQPVSYLGIGAHRHARKAVELDPADHEAHCILAISYLMHRDFDASHRHLERALDLNPNNAHTLAHACVALALMGEPRRGIEAGERALQLDPYHPDWYVASLGSARFIALEYEAAIETLAPVSAAFCDTPAYLAAAHARCSRPEKAAPYRRLVLRYYHERRKLGEVEEGTSCIDWLLSVNPFEHASDAENFADALRSAGFEA